MAGKVSVCPSCKRVYLNGSIQCEACKTDLIETQYTAIYWNKCDDGKRVELLSTIIKDYVSPEQLASLAAEAAEIKLRKEAQEEENRRSFSQRKLHFFSTTTPLIDGYKITEYIGICSGEYVLGTGFFSELDASISDLFGAAATGYSSKIGLAKDKALLEMNSNALQMGADAVVGVDLDLMTIGNNMVVACANGTAVKTEKL